MGGGRSTGQEVRPDAANLVTSKALLWPASSVSTSIPTAEWPVSGSGADPTLMAPSGSDSSI